MNTLKKFAVIVILPLALVLAGCSVGGSTHTSDKAVTATQPKTTPVNPLQKKLGDIISYKDGLSVSVSVPAPYTPTDEAVGVVAGDTYLVFNIVITNNSKKNVDIGGFPQLNSGGEAAHAISDVANNIGVPPNTTLLPTQSITFQDAYSVKDQNDLTYLISPAPLYDQAIFTSK